MAAILDISRASGFFPVNIPNVFQDPKRVPKKLVWISSVGGARGSPIHTQLLASHTSYPQSILPLQVCIIMQMGLPGPNRKFNYFLIRPAQPEIQLFLLSLPCPPLKENTYYKCTYVTSHIKRGHLSAKYKSRYARSKLGYREKMVQWVIFVFL